MSWTIKRGATEQTLADWGLGSGVVRKQNQAEDTASFAAEALAFDAEPIFAVDDAIELWRDREGSAGSFTGGTRVFVGEVVSVPCFATGSAEGQSYEVRNVWGALDEVLYEQIWYALTDPDDPESSLVGGRQSHVVLFQGFNGAKVTLGQQLADVVTLAAERGLSLQLSAGDAALLTITPPYEEARDLTCAEVIRKVLRWVPDAVTWFDYGTTPPTLRVQRRGSLAAVTLPAVSSAAAVVESVAVRSRPDLQAPGVVLKFERVNTLDGVPWRQLVTDKWPADASETARGTLIATVDLDGDQAQRSVARIVTRPLAPATADWWALRDREVALATAVDFGIGLWQATDDEGNAVTEGELITTGAVNELVSGQIAPWMLGESGVARNLRITAECELTTEATFWATGPISVAGHTLQSRVVATSLTTGTYTTTELLSQGEDVPTGLARALYDAVSALPYEGQVTLVADECPAVGFGALALTGGRAEWATMGAVIQAVEMDLGAGRTTVTFGPPTHLGLADLVELVRFNRQRRMSLTLTSRLTGKDGRRQAGEMGSHTAALDTTVARWKGTPSSLFAHVAAGDASMRQIQAAAAELKTTEDGAAETVARFQEVTVTVDGVPTRMMVLGQRLT